MLTKHTFPLLLAACLFQGALALPPAEAASSASSSGALDVNFFYDNLKNDGSWFNTTEYGDVWQPYIAYKSDSWRPYTDGYWSYTDGGWMFVSYEDFGWAVYHYGRWTQLKDIGWAWVPGTEWAPAWVTWRESKPTGTDAATPPPGDNAPPAANVAATTTDASNGQGTPPASPSDPSGAGGPPRNNAADGAPAGASQNYVGWAPLPPDPEPVAYNEGYAYGPSVDVDYGIDPYDYTYTDARFFGAPFLGAVIFDPGLNYYYGDRSVNISDFRYNDRGGYRGFYNGGPRYDQFRGVSERPIPQYNIRREQGRLAQQSVQTNRFNQINGKNINVVAPRFSQTNVRNGRMNFTHQGTLPVTQVGRVRPANEANNPARERAQNTFRQQGETFRSQHPDAPGVRRTARQTAPGGATGQPGAQIATTPRAQQEERAARQEARQEGPARNPGANPDAAEAGRAPGQPENRPGEAANQPPREGERINGHEDRAATGAQNGGESADHAARQEAHTTNTTARRSSGGRRSRGGSGGGAVRQSRGGGGGSGGHRGSGGGEHARGGGGGGHQGGGGGGGGHKGGGGGGKKH